MGIIQGVSRIFSETVWIQIKKEMILTDLAMDFLHISSIPWIFPFFISQFQSVGSIDNPRSDRNLGTFGGALPSDVNVGL